MSRLSDQQIENAFTKIRADFEERGNAKGLEILDGYEEQWDTTGSLSHRQMMWLERQLDGSWSSRAASAGQCDKSRNGDGRPPTNDADQVLDEMIRQRLVGQGRVVLEHDTLDALLAAIDDLRQIVSAMADRHSNGDGA